MKTKLYLLFFFVFPLFMSACRGDDPIPDPPVDGKRTVLVYMAADNSINPLASFTDGDLEELKAGMASIDNTSDMHLQGLCSFSGATVPCSLLRMNVTEQERIFQPWLE